MKYEIISKSTGTSEKKFARTNGLYVNFGIINFKITICMNVYLYYLYNS